jgi:hypothetical protein
MGVHHLIGDRDTTGIAKPRRVAPSATPTLQGAQSIAGARSRRTSRRSFPSDERRKRVSQCAMRLVAKPRLVDRPGGWIGSDEAACLIQGASQSRRQCSLHTPMPRKIQHKGGNVDCRRPQLRRKMTKHVYEVIMVKGYDAAQPSLLPVARQYANTSNERCKW